MTAVNGNSVLYDAIGNPIFYYVKGTGFSFTWTNGRQLSAIRNNSKNILYTYNDEGIRISKTIDGVEHVYQVSGTQIVSESWSSHTIFYIYDEMGSIAGMRYRTSSYAEGVFDEYLFEKNLQGDVVAVYNTSGTKLVSYKYDAWGKVTTTYHNSGSTTGARYNPFRYRGYYYDEDTGFYYLNSRYYDPSVGRFLNADVFINSSDNFAGFNMFAYCSNNPIMSYDPMGYAEVITKDSENDGTPTNDFGPVNTGNGNVGGNGHNNSGYTASTPPSSKSTSTRVHGNSQQSTNIQHGYTIHSAQGVEKVGVSGRPLNNNGTSPRANIQVNKLNRGAGYNKYWAQVEITNVPGRSSILIWEANMSKQYKLIGEPMSLHKYP